MPAVVELEVGETVKVKSAGVTTVTGGRMVRVAVAVWTRVPEVAVRVRV